MRRTFLSVAHSEGHWEAGGRGLLAHTHKSETAAGEKSSGGASLFKFMANKPEKAKQILHVPRACLSMQQQQHAACNRYFA